MKFMATAVVMATLCLWFVTSSAIAVKAELPPWVYSQKMVGFAEDREGTADLVKQVGANAQKVSVWWVPGRWQMASVDPDWQTLHNKVSDIEAAGNRPCIQVLAPAWKQDPQGQNIPAPVTLEQQKHFMTFVGNLASLFPEVRCWMIENEVNNPYFGFPQFGADGTDAAAPLYERLLAMCYDALKKASPDNLVIAGDLASIGNDDPRSGRPSLSPTLFLHDLAQAYLASGRSTPIMDALGLHPYEENSSVPPTTQHPDPSTTIALGDITKLNWLLGKDFGPTHQPPPAVIWDEFGVQSQVDTRLYTGAESAGTEPVDQATQGQYYAKAIQMACAQPNVIGIFLFLLIDMRDLSRWQSGLMAPLPNGAARLPQSADLLVPKAGMPAVQTAMTTATTSGQCVFTQGASS